MTPHADFHCTVFNENYVTKAILDLATCTQEHVQESARVFHERSDQNNATLQATPTASNSY
jgi:hypothetical protein